MKLRAEDDVPLCLFFIVADPSTWPEMDSQPLSLEDSWRLRVASAQAYSIMKNRDIEHFERVMAFLDDTYRLLPRLVAPIKHMKIMFGLKTMVWIDFLFFLKGFWQTYEVSLPCMYLLVFYK